MGPIYPHSRPCRPDAPWEGNTSKDHEIEYLRDKNETLLDDLSELKYLFTMSLFLNVAFVAATVVTWLI
jgi:hypothetical protein